MQFLFEGVDIQHVYFLLEVHAFGCVEFRVWDCMCQVITMVRQQKLSVLKLSLTLASSSWGQVPVFIMEEWVEMVSEKLINLSLKLGERISFCPDGLKLGRDQ